MIDKIEFASSWNYTLIAPDTEVFIGDHVLMGNFTSLEVRDGGRLSIGDRVFFNDSCVIRCMDEITIGEDTMIGDGVKFYDSDHVYSRYHVEKLAMNTAPIHVGKNCWLGSNVVVMKGVTIGDNVIVGANCVVRQDIPSNSLVYQESKVTIKERRQAKYHALTLTYSDQLEHLAYLAEQLPEVDFHIAAPTGMSDYLLDFRRYDNIQLYQTTEYDALLDQLVDRATFYLDNNHWEEVEGIISRMQEANKPIFSFENVSHIGGGYASPEEMVRDIRVLLVEKEAE